MNLKISNLQDKISNFSTFPLKMAIVAGSASSLRTISSREVAALKIEAKFFRNNFLTLDYEDTVVHV